MSASASPVSETPALDVRLQHAFAGGFKLDVAFTTQHRAVAVFGPSGSGKTTFLNALTGLFRPQHGRIALGGRVLFDREAGVFLPPRRRHIGLVVQDGLLFPLLSVRQNLMFGAPAENAKLSLERVSELLEIQHLLDRRPRNLSGGERQRVALGRAVLSEPSLLLCDEPFSALDTARRRRLVPILGRLSEELNLPMVLVSHSASEVLALAGEVIVLEEGSLRAHGPTLSLLEDLSEEGGSALNVWEGVVLPPEADHDDPAIARVRIAEGVVMHAQMPPVAPGRRVRLSVPPSVVALSSSQAGATSARNQLAGHVVALRPQKGMIRVTVDVGVPVNALLTAGAVQELGLTAGTAVTAGFKAAATNVLWVEAAGPE
ncbi:MAG: molybdenum ABC transporter ATP-binding protein [Planctomycetota bacterium]|jgi:molybdate transport system ATP-binding protein